MSPPVRPRIDPADLWDWLVHKGVSEDEATKHVNRYLQSITPAEKEPVSAGSAVLRNAGQTATFGLADEFLGALESARGGNGPAMKEAIRDQLSRARAERPISSVAGAVAGGFVNPVKYLLGPLTAGLGPKMTGAIYGGTYGAGEGFGEATGSPADRAPAAALGGVLGIPLGVATGYVGEKLGPSLRQIVRNVRGIGGRAPVEAIVDRVAPNLPPHEAGDALSDISQAYRDFKAGRISETDLNTALDFAGNGMRGAPTPAPELPHVSNPQPIPGYPRGISVEGPPTPPVHPTLLEGQPAIPGRPDLGTLVEGSPTQTAGSPLRTQSPSVPSSVIPTQMQMIVDALKGVPRTEWLNQLAPFRALGLLSDAEVQQLLQAP